MARPETEINWEMFEQLCALQCTQSEIASVLKISDETLRTRAKAKYEMDNYLDIYKKFSEHGKTSLRRNQFAQSKKSASMAIWLGKQWLGQKDLSKEQETLYNTFSNLLQRLDNGSKELVKDDKKEIEVKPIEEGSP